MLQRGQAWARGGSGALQRDQESGLVGLGYLLRGQLQGSWPPPKDPPMQLSALPFPPPQRLQTFPVKGQIVNLLGFVGHIWSLSLFFYYYYY